MLRVVRASASLVFRPIFKIRSVFASTAFASSARASSALASSTKVGVCALFLVSFVAVILTGCGGPAPHEDGLTWHDKPLAIVARWDAPNADTLRAGGWGVLVKQAPQRILRIEAGEWGDSLWLLEFRDEAGAYAAFQELSTDDETVAAGLALSDARVYFRRGRWIGALDAWSWKGEEWFLRALSLPGAPSGSVGLPDLFGSLLHQNRLPGTERILTGDFMGRPISEPVYAMRADCRGDTAWVYAAPGLGLNFAKSLSHAPGWSVDTVRGLWKGVQVTSRITDLPPVTLRFSKRGMVGVEGCFDQNLTEFWLKMQARGLKNLK